MLRRLCARKERNLRLYVRLLHMSLPLQQVSWWPNGRCGRVHSPEIAAELQGGAALPCEQAPWLCQARLPLGAGAHFVWAHLAQGQAGDDTSRRIIAEEVQKFIESNVGVEVRGAAAIAEKRPSLLPSTAPSTSTCGTSQVWACCLQEEDVAVLEEQIRHRLAGKGVTGWVPPASADLRILG
jgi:hypothetical protein